MWKTSLFSHWTDDMLHPLLDIRLVDFGNPYDINGFVSLLCQIGSKAGMTMPDFRPTRESNVIRQLANKVARKLDEQLPVMSAADAFSVLHAYDLVHRFAYMTPADRNTFNRYVLNVFEAMIHGDKSVDQFALFREIASAVARRDKAYLDKPVRWMTIKIGQWYDDMTQDSRQMQMCDNDIINRAGILLGYDLFAYEGRNQDRFKRNLFDSNRHYLDCHDNTELTTLYSLEAFFNASLRFMKEDEAERYRAQLDLERISSPATNRFLRAALEIGLSLAG